MEIGHAGADNLLIRAVQKDPDQRSGKNPDDYGNKNTEDHRYAHSKRGSPADPLFFLPAVILGNKKRKGVAEFLGRHVGQCVDLHRHRKSRHDHCSETVYQTLDHQDTEIHHRLLGAGDHGIPHHSVQRIFSKAHIFSAYPKRRYPPQCIRRYTDAGYSLGDHRSLRSAGNASVQSGHKPDIQKHIHNRRYRQKPERHYRVPHGAEKTGKIIIEINKNNPRENHPYVIVHQRIDIFRNLKKSQNRIRPDKYDHVQDYRHDADKPESGPHALFQLFFIFRPKSNRKNSAASHTQPYDHGIQKSHQRVGGTHRRQRFRSQEPAHHHGIRDIVYLLKQIPQNHGNRKDQHCF